ncbi:helix-turn-helix domain-containing protein [Cytobacillus massiliigabonensis]|uniref:helix-turn-helix domain-containing protein n=1 Tax=Cytobacillus massiliigabonensis TaxID=1871011 RepID=UPI000C85E296|nr:helix-turn-helix transcriptional regulator [Cytobacillus massiliigabonensis]
MEDYKLKYIGPTLKRLRKAKLLTQEDLADNSTVHRKTISLLENNLQEPLLGTISSLAEGLAIDLSDFIKEVEEDVLNGKYR